MKLIYLTWRLISSWTKSPHLTREMFTFTCEFGCCMSTNYFKFNPAALWIGF